MSGCCNSGGNDKNAVIKDYIKDRYGKLAESASSGKRGSCSDGCCGETSKDAITSDIYAEAETTGIPVEALLASAGCANPVALAALNPGEVVLDLGSGGGIDVLLSAKRVGPTGKAYGLDMTDEMLELARKNQKESGIENVEFIKGEIENIPLPDKSVDVIISNCVINLSTDKLKVLQEANRVLKPGGRFAVADIVFIKPMPDVLRDHFSLWTGCISGALTIEDYKSKMIAAGFVQAEVEIARTYSPEDAEGILPADVMQQLSKDEIKDLMDSFVSAFIRGVKPKPCCPCCG